MSMTLKLAVVAVVLALLCMLGQAWVREPLDIAAVVFASIAGASSVLLFAVAWTTRQLR